MTYDFRANQVRLNKIISSGSIPILIYPSSSASDFDGNVNFSTSGIGSDVFLFVSGNLDGTSKTLFGGNVVTSGSVRSFAGLTGSLRYVDESNNPLIVAGPDISVTYNSLGQWEISGSEAGFFSSPSNNIVNTTGSFEATYLSASTGAEITGSLTVNGGITGSLSGTLAGNPFVVAGPNITTNYNSLGQWEITGSAVNYFTEIALNSIATTGSVAMTYLSASTGAEITGSLAQGLGINATGFYSHAEGTSTIASGFYAHAEGSSTNAAGLGSHAEGSSTTANGWYSHAEGTFSITNGDFSHAEGSGATTYGSSSHAEGFAAASYGDFSHAEGAFSTTNGLYSHAEGYFTLAHGEASHAEGFGSETVGTGSFAAGLYTVASSSIDGTFPPPTIQAAFGKYNLQGNTDSLFVIGDGFDASNRHDVLRVNSGSVEVTGSLNITGSVSAITDVFKINGFNIVTLWNHATTSNAQQNTNLSGSLLSDNMPSYGIGLFDINVIAVADDNSAYGSWKFSVTVTSSNTTVTTDTATELDNVLIGANATSWDVNFNGSSIEVTGSTNTVYWMAKVTNKMILSSSGQVIY